MTPDEIQEAIRLGLEKNKQMEEANRLESESLKKARELIEIQKEKNKEIQKNIDLIKEELKNEKNVASVKEIYKNLLKEQNKELTKANELLRLQELEYEGIRNKQEQINRSISTGKDLFKSMFSGDFAGGASKVMSTLGGKIEKNLTKKLLDAGTAANGTRAAAMAMAPMAAAGVFMLFSKAIFDLAVKLHDAEGAFMATTGASREFAHSLSNSYGETREFGATIQQTSAAITSLFMNFTDFTFQNEKTRESLTNTATVLSKLGVSTDDFSKSIQNMTKAMGMNAEGAAQQLLNLEKFAEELGVAPSKIASDFAGAGGQLAKFGDQGVQAFKDLQIASKITGLEMQRILNITEKFDTFEGAATQAGKLNAALGGNFVNAMDLMMSTDPVERFEQIRGAVLNAGLSFDEMSYYQKNFYKEALGLSDVGELALVLSGKTDLLSESFDKSSQSYEDAAERAKTLASFQEKLNILFADIVPILTPIIDVLSSVMSFLADSAQGFSMLYDFLSQFTGLVETLTMAFFVLGAGIAIAFFPFTVIILKIMAVVAVITALIIGIGKLMHTIFHQRNSPTFFEGLGMMPEMFSDLGGEIEVTSKSMQGMGKTMESTPIPAASETLAGTTNSGTNASFSGGDAGMQTVRQPMEINLNGDKLEKFIVEVLGANIKKISILQ
tara:strand:- start:6868 stop:8877 length:2010 start_codon:yes stop_codon:yes gene_type:complete